MLWCHLPKNEEIALNKSASLFQLRWDHSTTTTKKQRDEAKRIRHAECRYISTKIPGEKNWKSKQQQMNDCNSINIANESWKNVGQINAAKCFHRRISRDVYLAEDIYALDYWQSHRHFSIHPSRCDAGLSCPSPRTSYCKPCIWIDGTVLVGCVPFPRIHLLMMSQIKYFNYGNYVDPNGGTIGWKEHFANLSGTRPPNTIMAFASIHCIAAWPYQLTSHNRSQPNSPGMFPHRTCTVART